MELQFLSTGWFQCLIKIVTDRWKNDS